MSQARLFNSLTTAPRASDVEAVDGDIQIFLIRRLLSGIELPSLVDVFAARHACLMVSFV